MKRKFKLFATVASLCLCLALMAFGVYAASNVTYNASGSVTFEVNNVFVKAETKVYKADNAAGKKVAEPKSATYTNVYNSLTDERSSLVDDNWTDLSEYKIGELDFADAGAFKIVIKLTNLSVENGITVTSHACTGTELTNATIQEADTNSSKSSIDVSTDTEAKYVELVYFVSLDDVAKVASGNWSIKIELDKATD